MKNLFKFKKEYVKYVVVGFIALALIIAVYRLLPTNGSDINVPEEDMNVELPVETEEPIIIESIEPYKIIFVDEVFDGFPLSDVINVQDSVQSYIVEFCNSKGYSTAEVFDVVKDYEYDSYSVHIVYDDEWYQCISVESDYSEPLVLYNTKYNSWVLNEYN